MKDWRWLLALAGLCAALACGRVGFEALAGGDAGGGDGPGDPGSPQADAGPGDDASVEPGDPDAAPGGDGGTALACEDTCTCPRGDSCDFDCGAYRCIIDCEPQSSCQVRCSGCAVGCGDGASCTVECLTANCSLQCSASSQECTCVENGGRCV